MAPFCEDEFWTNDTTLSSNSSVPILSQCFQHTVLAGTPCLFFWILVPVLTIQLHLRPAKTLHWNTVTSMKSLLMVLLSVDKLFVLSIAVKQAILSERAVPIIEFIAPSLQIITLAGIWIANNSCRLKGVNSSGVLFSTWLMFLVMGIPEFYTWIKLGTDPSTSVNLNFWHYLAYLAWYPLVCLQFILFALPEGNKPKSTSFNKKRSPEEDASFLSRQSYWWFNKIVSIGHKRSLTTDDLYDLDGEVRAENLEKKWDKHWRRAYEDYRQRLSDYETEMTFLDLSTDSSSTSSNHSSKYGSIDALITPSSKEAPDNGMMKPQPPSIISRLFVIFKWELIGSTLVKLLSDLLQFASPLLLNLLLNFTENASAPWWEGLALAVAIFAAAEVRSLLFNSYFYIMYRVAAMIQSLLTTAVYTKAMKLSNSARREKSLGEIVNLMAIDIDRFYLITPQIQQFWSGPLQIILSIALLWQMLGVSVVSGIVVMLVLMPTNFLTSIVVKRWQGEQMRLKDERIKMVNELLNGIKVVKLYAWEPPMEAAVAEIRRREVQLMKKASLVRTICSIINRTSPFLVALFSFATFTLSSANNVLTPQIAFVSLTLFNQLRGPMILIADLISQTVQVMVSNRRLKDFLVSEEINRFTVHRSSNASKEDAIECANAILSWDTTSRIPNLRNLSFTIKKGSLVAIIGTVGSGKSSLLNALLGEMRKVDGYIAVNGEIAYVPQQSWITNQTLRQNVLLGRAYDRFTYQQVVTACALNPDLENLPNGDLTEIGEKGINLSGGQKARVSLARAVYQNCDIYLLDDPLSAVDTHVGKEIFDNLIGPKGMLSSKTRVLVTHGLHYLKDVDLIMIMKEGKVKAMGTYYELMDNPDAVHMINVEAAETDTETPKSSEMGDVVSVADNERASPPTDPESVRSRKKSKVSSVKSKQSTIDAPIMSPSKGRTTTDENIESGKVRFSVYLDYFKAMCYRYPLLFAVFTIIGSGLSMWRNIWLSQWSDDNSAVANHTYVMPVGERLGVFGAIGISETLFTLVALFLLVVGTVNASINLHSPLMHSLLRSPMSFFDVTPIGRILNRVGKDIEVVDLRLPSDFNFFVICALNVLQTVIIIMLSTPLFGVAVVPIAFIYVFILRYFIDTSRQLQRLASVTRSPVYSHFGESLQGVSSIRAYGAIKQFSDMSLAKVDSHMRCKYLSLISNRWLAVRLELIGNCIILFAALFAVLAKLWGTATAGAIGLSVSYSLNVTVMLNFLVRQISSLETDIVAVERINEYCKTPNEAPWYLKNPKLGQKWKHWPLNGSIEFRNYSARYRDGLDLVLRDVSVRIDALNKVGVVGRTGAGKSSITLALFRIIEADQGSILIDGVDISLVGLHNLRSKITIIPQDPVLFSGSLRFNLDPFDKYTDSDLWTALEHASLKEFVQSQPQQLSTILAEGGQNISVGQRQLVCLTRAILRKSSILVLDEATAAIDTSTDALIQCTIREQFPHSTIITIAHRLNTVIDYDRIIVMDYGRIIEYDTPQALLRNESSMFYAMVRNAKLV